MNIQLFYAPLFERRFKRFSKKFPSLESDLKQFLHSIENSKSVDLGGGIYKYRLAVRSKNKGKSGGFRVITLEVIVSSQSKNITMLTMYDKTDQSTISKTEINNILQDIGES